MSTQDTLPKQLPEPGGLTPQQLRQFVDKRIYYNSPIRARDESRWREAELKDQGEHWIRRAYTAHDSAYASQWVARTFADGDPDAIPTPSYNEGLAIRQNESARLSRPQYEAHVRIKGDHSDFRIRKGAQKGEQTLKSELYRIGWDRHQDLGHYHSPLYGDWFIEFKWDSTWDQTVLVPVKGAKACSQRKGEPGEIENTEFGPITLGGRPPCDFVTAQPTGPVGGGGEQPLDSCPQCEDHPPLDPFQPNMEEAGTSDSFGRPLGEQQPKGQLAGSTVNPHNVFLPNAGIGVDATNITEWVHVHVESIDDYVALRWPDKAQLVKAENPATLMEYHPIAGAPNIYGSRDPSLFTNHVRIKEYHHAPWLAYDEETKTHAMNKGRSVILAGEQVLLDAPYMIPNLTKPGQWTPRVKLWLAPHEFRDGGQRAHGLSLWELMFDANHNINVIASQKQSVRERMAVPMYVSRRGANWETAPNRVGLPGKFTEIDVDGEFPNPLPVVMNNEALNPEHNYELEWLQGHMGRMGSMVEVDRGQVPPGVAAATAISYLLNESSERRKPRIRRIKEMLGRAFTYALELIAGQWIEPREYRYEAEDGDEAWGYVTGLELEDQTEVEVEASAEDDTPEVRREKLRDLVTLGIVRPGISPQMDRVIAELLEAPEGLYVDDDLQEESAQREWFQFIEKGVAPVINPSLDDPGTHYQVHGRSAHSERFRELCEKANWNGALKILGATWDADLQAAANEPMLFVRQAVQQLQQAQAAGLPVPPMPQPPPIADLQDRIAKKWLERLGLVPTIDPMTNQPMPPQRPPFEVKDQQAFQDVVTWLSHTESHKLGAEQKLQQAQAAPTMAAPGADATSVGTEPTAGAGQAPQPAMVQ